MAAMKAWRLHELGLPWEVLRLEDVDGPEPPPGTARIRVEATDLNFADILQCQGSYQEKRQPPFTPGMSAAGTVLATGPGSGVEVGQRIIGSSADGWGGYAEEALVRSDAAHVLPDHIDGRTAAGMHVTHGTAWFALHHRGRIRPEETVLVLAAAGGVGAAAVQLAKAHGCRVIAAAGGPEKVAVCRQLGADVAIDYSGEDLYQAVMEATGGEGADVVYDPVGGPYFDIARRLVAFEGRLLVVGFASGTIPAAPANHVLVKNYSVVGVHMGLYRTKAPHVVTECYEQVWDLKARSGIDPLISDTIGLADVPAGLKRLSERTTTGRVVLVP
jgi:NADPH:quinone reductase